LQRFTSICNQQYISSDGKKAGEEKRWKEKEKKVQDEDIRLKKEGRMGSS